MHCAIVQSRKSAIAVLLSASKRALCKGFRSALSGRCEMKTAFLFNGQGSQYVGMGKDIYEHYSAAKQIYRKVSEATGVDVVTVSFHSTPELIKDSKHAQESLWSMVMTLFDIPC